MTNSRGVPERRPDVNQAGRNLKKPTVVKVLVPQPRLPAIKPPVPPPPPLGTQAAPPEDRRAKVTEPLRQPIASGSRRSPNPAVPPLSPPPKAPADLNQPRRRSGWVSSWQFWSILAILIFTGIGGLSIALLLKLPALPNCPAIFWPTASASLRLYCAQVAANKETVDDLLEAIALVNNLPTDHPLRPEVNRHIGEWSTAILDLAEDAFNQGKLQDAITTANRIPANTPAYSSVAERIQHWQTIWAKAESIYKDAKEALNQQDLRGAFAIAVRLLDVDNEYWRTTKYQELNNLITATRQDGSKLTRARGLANRGGLENLLAAIKAAEEISSSSPLHSEAERLIQEFGRKMLDLAESRLDQQDAEAAIEIAQKIPPHANLQSEVQDFTDLAEAQKQAWGGTVADLEAAIIQAQRLEPDRPLYGRAQQLVSQWQLEIQDVNRLETARQLAESGDLTSAISEAELIPRDNPRGAEARREISSWTAQIETTEDRPYLDQAEQLAQNGDVASLQAAIDQAGRIRSERTLYSEARRRIAQWTSQVEAIQDQPYLDRARQLAEMGNLPDAIATAQQISSGRALYREAQANIRTWRDQSQNQVRLREAYQAASSGTPLGLASAIRIADQISSDSSVRPDANRMIDLWSRAILQFAQEQAQYDPAGAIATAQNIPSRSDAYREAQLQIQAWQQRLEPAAPPAIEQPTGSPY